MLSSTISIDAELKSRRSMACKNIFRQITSIFLMVCTNFYLYYNCDATDMMHALQCLIDLDSAVILSYSYRCYIPALITFETGPAVCCTFLIAWILFATFYSTFYSECLLLFNLLRRTFYSTFYSECTLLHYKPSSLSLFYFSLTVLLP